jgi:hypothetical protein
MVFASWGVIFLYSALDGASAEDSADDSADASADAFSDAETDATSFTGCFDPFMPGESGEDPMEQPTIMPGATVIVSMIDNAIDNSFIMEPLSASV